MLFSQFKINYFLLLQKAVTICLISISRLSSMYYQFLFIIFRFGILREDLHSISCYRKGGEFSTIKMRVADILFGAWLNDCFNKKSN